MMRDIAENLGNPFAEKYDLWPVIEKETNQPVGHCGLLEKEVEGEPEVEVVYVIDSPHWGKGYATEISKALIEYAFGTRGLRRIIALIKPGNKGSESVATKIGMHLEKEVVRPNDIRMLLYVIER
jgi:RimJ/RimL family protein N-acetyltransferase